MQHCVRILLVAFVLLPVLSAKADDVKKTAVYARLKAKFDAVRGIDTHSHLRGPVTRLNVLENRFRAKPPTNSAVYRVWQSSYYPWGHGMRAWPADGDFIKWWNSEQPNFERSRARGAYRTMLPIFTDLYGVDFETLTPEQAEEVNTRMEEKFADPDWGEEVLRRRANTQFLIVDSYWRPNGVRDHYPFTFSTFNVQWHVYGFHRSEFRNHPVHDPYAYAKTHKLPLESVDDYVAVLDHMMAAAKKAGVVCLKSPNAYQRTLRYDWVPKKRAAEAFGKPRKELNHGQVKAFEDYVFWRITELAAKHDLPFQIHTGHARIQGSNPMNLCDLIQANPKTKFILFHGGFPWVGESGMIALRYPNVWLDSVWMPVLSYNMGRRAYKEWLDMISYDRIMWGSDIMSLEGTYGTTIYTRQCIYEALAEKVVDGQLSEAQAERIGRAILRENALKMFPTIRKRAEEEAGK